MRIISETIDFQVEQGTAVAIGKFDGVHMGHRKILAEILRQREDGLLAVVFTFAPSPEVFFGMSPSQELSTKEEKRKLFEELGIDILVEFPFNKETAAIRAEDFVTRILVDKLHTKFVAAGTDLSFGDHGRGNFALLDNLARQYGFETEMIDKVEREGKVISSTLIRKLIQKGEMEEAAACLGSPYSITGAIVHGRALGRRIGIPTLNQMPPADKLLPPFGVYYSEVEVDGTTYKGMTNIGIKPTVTEEKRVTVETHLYNFDGNLYGEFAEVRLLTYRRPEMKFSGIEELKATMEADIEDGKKYHGLLTNP